MAIPSLAMIPSGYKDGKVYSVLPSNGDGDFTFSRGSRATRVNKDGLIETMPLELGGELVTNGGFDTDSDWIKDTGWSISGGSLNGSSTTTSATQLNTGLVAGKMYQVVYTISNYVSGSVRIELGSANVSVGTTRSANGTYTEYIEALGDEQLIFDGISAFTGSIDNVSIKEVLSGYDLPRLDYSDSSCPSLLLEPQRSNLITYSEDFSQWSIFDNTTTQANYGITPDGTQNSFKIASSGAVNDFIYKSLSITPSTNYTISFFIKNIDSQQTEFFNPSQNEIIINWNGSNIQSITSGATYESFGNDWYRITATSQSLSSGSLVVRFYPSTLSASSIELFGYQLEEGSYATSYIPTQGSAVTRLADSCTNGGNEQVINSTEGTLYLETATLVNTQTADNSITLTDGGNNKIIFRYRNTNAFNVKVFVNGVAQAEAINHTLSNATDFNKIAVKWKLNDYEIYVNGISVFTDSNALVFPNNSINSLGFADALSTPFYGKTKAVAVYKEALTDAELQALTT